LSQIQLEDLPGLDCGLCGYRTCADLAEVLPTNPDLVKRCTMLSAGESMRRKQNVSAAPGIAVAEETPCGACAVGGMNPFELAGTKPVWLDSLGREFDFFLEHFPEEPGPREIILPHNPLITREMEIQPGDIMLGRPLGMSCGCPITHCGVCMSADHRTGVIVWCVTGPLQTRQGNFKDLGYYIAEGYEGLIKDARCEIKIGMRYYFQPRMCMLQWRHSGLVNYLSRTEQGLQVRVEGLWIG
jgi:uncharacterized Fe-S cluster-containing protein